MRQLTAADLPWILRKLNVPTQVRRALAGLGADVESNLPDNVPQYSEDVIFGAKRTEIQMIGGVTPTPTVDSVNNIEVVQTSPGDAPTFADIYWNCINYTGGLIHLTGNRSRVVLIVQNIGAAACAVNFGSAANYSATASQVAGIILPAPSAGSASTIYADTYCPTNDVYIDAASGPTTVVVVQGTRVGPQPPLWTVTGQAGGP